MVIHRAVLEEAVDLALVFEFILAVVHSRGPGVRVSGFYSAAVPAPAAKAPALRRQSYPKRGLLPISKLEYSRAAGRCQGWSF